MGLVAGHPPRIPKALENSHGLVGTIYPIHVLALLFTSLMLALLSLLLVRIVSHCPWG